MIVVINILLAPTKKIWRMKEGSGVARGYDDSP
jgi:hypothetical protein